MSLRENNYTIQNLRLGHILSHFNQSNNYLALLADFNVFKVKGK